MPATCPAQLVVLNQQITETVTTEPTAAVLRVEVTSTVKMEVAVSFEIFVTIYKTMT